MEKKFFDRYNELHLLKERYEKLNSGELLVIYGRRRIGKTELLRQFLEKSDCKKIYLYVNIAEKQELMRQFSKSILDQTGDGIKISNWDGLFDYLKTESDDKKMIVVLDEFQRFAKVSPDFISMLQDNLDRKLKNNKIMIILSGSSMGMTHELIFSTKGPLYGRASLKKKIEPFRYVDFRQMFSHIGDEEKKIAIYSFFGGTPYYLEAVKNEEKELFECISNLVLDENGRLFDEPITLLSSELKSFQRHNSILVLIAKGKNDLKEIADGMGMDQGQLTPHLHHLVKLLDIVHEEKPVLGMKKGKRYVFSDNFFRFWYRYIFQNKSAIELKNYSSVIAKIKDSYPTYLSRNFQDIIKELLILYNGAKIGKIDLDFEEIGSWWDKNDEIDIVCRGKRSLVVGEVKYTEKPINGLSLFNELKAKAEKIKFSGRINYLIVSKSGFESDTRDVLEKSGVTCLDLNEIKAHFEKLTKIEKERQQTLNLYT
jgi:hypothetical protein